MGGHGVVFKRSLTLPMARVPVARVLRAGLSGGGVDRAMGVVVSPPVLPPASVPPLVLQFTRPAPQAERTTYAPQEIKVSKSYYIIIQQHYAAARLLWYFSGT